MVSVNPPSGFRDFINDEARRRLKLMSLIADVYQSFGFSPLETPVVENLELLQGGGGGEENEKLIFKILKRGSKLEEALQVSGALAGTATSTVNGIDENKLAEFGLRFDLTLPLSRAVAFHRGEIRFPWKVFHIGPVWRAERPQKGRFREFIQCDVDIIGAKGIGAEIEVIQAVVNAVHKVGAPAFELRINDRRLIEAMARNFGFADEKLQQFAVLLDKKDKLDSNELISQFKELAGAELSKELLSFIEGTLSIEFAEKYHPEAVKDLQTIISTLDSLKLPLSQIVFDPSLVRGMGYYTGPVFELRHSSAGYSFGGGGRYDKLIGRLSGQEIPACGFSIGFERLSLLLAEQEQKSEATSKTVFLPVFEEDLRPRILGLASQLRQTGLECDVYPDRAKIKNQFKFASDSAYRWVIIAAGDEWASGIFKVKDFKSGTEISVPDVDIVSYLKSCILTKSE
jgi:histidyl-tRNA synthetase